jgi:rod shape-determining protein MreC
MPVISGGNVVGRIISVSPLTSQIQLIRAPEERVSIEHVASASVGILESTINGTLFANFRSISSVDVGDTVHTTGLGGIYPRGFKVGTVERIVAPRDGDIFKQIYIKSAINFDRLRNVFVVKSLPHWGAAVPVISDEETGGEE